MCDSEDTCKLPPAPSPTPATVPSDYLPPLSVLKGLKLVQLKDGQGEEVDSESLWANKSCLIYLVRRPGCVLCRNKAKELMEIRDELMENGVGMAAIVHEELGVQEFRTKFWPSDPLYLNSDKSFFSAIHDDRKVRKQGLLSGLFSADMWRRIRGAKAAGVEGNLEGEGRILGAILLMGKGDGGVKWIRTEKSFGDHATNQEIISAVKAMRA